MIPGSGFGVGLIKNVISESIVNIERAVLEEEINVVKSIGNIFLGSVIDSGTDKISGMIDAQMEKLVPKTYSGFAGKYRKLFPDATKEEIVNRQQLETMAMRRTKRFALLVVDTGNALIKPNFYDFGW